MIWTVIKLYLIGISLDLDKDLPKNKSMVSGNPFKCIFSFHAIPSNKINVHLHLLTASIADVCLSISENLYSFSEGVSFFLHVYYVLNFHLMVVFNLHGRWIFIFNKYWKELICIKWSKIQFSGKYYFNFSIFY